jgi:hypothetical protein
MLAQELQQQGSARSLAASKVSMGVELRTSYAGVLPDVCSILASMIE